jgi:prevent-host-death family protein
MISITSVEAQNRFGQLLDTAQREAVAITRHGRPAAFVVSPRDMEELLDARRKRGRALAELDAWGAGTTAARSQPQATASAALSDDDVVRLVHESR